MSKIKVDKKYWPNRKLKYERPYQNDRYHGIIKHWHENGLPLCEIPHKNGQRHGITKWYDKNGHLNLKIYYLYDNRITEKEYRKHILTEKLAGLE